MATGDRLSRNQRRLGKKWISTKGANVFVTGWAMREGNKIGNGMIVILVSRYKWNETATSSRNNFNREPQGAFVPHTTIPSP